MTSPKDLSIADVVGVGLNATDTLIGLAGLERSKLPDLVPTGSLLGGLPGAGHGIIGMRERVTLLGGEFSAGPLPGYGFRVSARIPVPSSSR